MVISQVRNITEYHSVFADSLISIVNMLGKSNESDARKIMVFNIRQAYILYRMDDQRQRPDLETKVTAMYNAWVLESKIKKDKGTPPSYVDVLNDELEAMKLDDMKVPELEICMFVYMSLAGIKPVQNTAQRAAGYSRFVSAE